jgi:hypothetical protein
MYEYLAMFLKKPTFALDLSLPEIRKRVKYADVGPDVDITVFDNDYSATKIAAKGKWIIKDGCKIFRVSINKSSNAGTSESFKTSLQAVVNSLSPSEDVTHSKIEEM